MCWRMATSDDFLLDFVGMPHLMKVQLVVTSLLFFVRTEVLRVCFIERLPRLPELEIQKTPPRFQTDIIMFGQS